MIGDGILFFLEENCVSLVGRPSAHNWVQYHAETGDYDVTFDRDERTAVNPTGRRKFYRFQVQGPTALDVLRRRTAGRCPRSSSSTSARSRSAARRCARCTTACPACPASSCSGRGRRREDVRAAIVEAGEDFGLRQVGSRVYATNTLESGWIPCPLPAVFTGDEMKAYREWLPANGYEATGSLGGSYYVRRHRRLLPDAARPRLLGRS